MTTLAPAPPAARAPSKAAALFTFPDPVNEVSARLVAAGVLVMGIVALVFDEHVRWLLGVLAYGFVARALTGPTLSPLGQLVTRVVTPRSGFAEKPVPGPPKRFAQGMGVVFTVTALVLTLLGKDVAARAVLALLVVAATLESVFALCPGCKVFALLMRVGVIPEEVCERCNNLTRVELVGRAPRSAEYADEHRRDRRALGIAPGPAVAETLPTAAT